VLAPKQQFLIGSSFDLPPPGGFDQFLPQGASCRAGAHVFELDRWGRSLVDLVNTLQELTALEVGFVSMSEALDLTTPSGRALAGMLAVFAEFERDILRDRVKAGIDQARKDGKPHGRPII